MNKLKHWLKYRRIFKLVEGAALSAANMQHWGRSYNLFDRLDRVMGNAPQHRLQRYQKFKQMLAADAGWQGEWQFDPYTLS